MSSCDEKAGYPARPPRLWPQPARSALAGRRALAVQFVVNYEEGGENNILHGDPASEAFLSDVLGAQPWPGQRHGNIESMYEYGSRAGFWRLWRMFTERQLPVTVFGVATALQRNPEDRRRDAGSRLGYRQPRPEMDRSQGHVGDRGARQIAESIRLHAEATGERPLGWYTGRTSINTLRPLMEAGGLLYLVRLLCRRSALLGRGAERIASDHSLHASTPTTCASPTRRALRRRAVLHLSARTAFDVLYAEGATSPKMMSVGLHCRLVGRPGRAAALLRFLDYIGEHRESLDADTARDRATLARPPWRILRRMRTRSDKVDLDAENPSPI